MASFLENAYTIVGQDNTPQTSIQELKMSLEKGSDEIKVWWTTVYGGRA
jgi:hypothetical protein